MVMIIIIVKCILFDVQSCIYKYIMKTTNTFLTTDVIIGVSKLYDHHCSLVTAVSMATDVDIVTDIHIYTLIVIIVTSPHLF